MKKTALQLIKDKKKELSDLHERMDIDRDIVTMSPYKMLGISDQFKDLEIPGTISVTMNKASVFAESYMSTLATVKRQAVVSGLSDTANHNCEEFIDDLFYTIDQEMPFGNLALWFAQHVSLRGALGFMLELDREYNLKPTPIDMRWCTYQEAGKRYEWLSNHTVRDGDDLLHELEGKTGYNLSLIPEGSKDLEVENWWNEERSELWVKDQQVGEVENTYGEVPAVLVFPLTGLYIMDKGYSKHRSESIFWLNRELYDEWHRLASILQSMAIAIIKPPLGQEKDVGGADPYPPTGAVTAYGKGEVPKPVFTPDLTQAFITSYNNFNQAIQMGGISDADLGSAELDRPGIWYTQQFTIRGRRMSPRIDAISQMYSKIVQLALRELKTFKAAPKLGQRKKVYNNLPDPEEITVEFKLMTEDKVMDVVRRAEAVSMRGTLSHYDILKDILHHEDPDGVLNRIYLEQAIGENPIVRYREIARRLIVLAGDKVGQEKEDILADAEVYADMMVDAIDNAEMVHAQGAEMVEQPKGQGQAVQAISGMIGNQKQLAAPKGVVSG